MGCNLALVLTATYSSGLLFEWLLLLLGPLVVAENVYMFIIVDRTLLRVHIVNIVA